MNAVRMTAALCALALCAAAAAGCGGKSDKAGEDEAFRVPDTLLSPLQSFQLTRDDYHPVDGGVMANDRIELHYPPAQYAQYLAVEIFSEAMRGYATVRERIGRPSNARVVIVGTKDLSEYRFLTRKEWWYYAVIEGDTIICEPLDIMRKRFDSVTDRSISEIGLAQRMAQMALDLKSAGRIPVWLREGAASHIANERPVLRAQIEQFRKELDGYRFEIEDLEHTLRVNEDMMLARAAFFVSFRMVERLLERATMEDIVAFASRLGEGVPLDDASRESFGMPYDQLIAAVAPTHVFDGAGEVPRPPVMGVDDHDGHSHD
ncbi:MAG: hypothetical protein PHQ19_02220 [Candidatus Krumholzibacteria bacterium]|nr:hypothetical protein [Candidatus Krumholzibacteria bacterium]